MGFAIAEACAEQGAKVTLVAGPVSLKTYHPNIHRIDVVSASEMFDTTNDHFRPSDIAIFCAAVADFTPTVQHENKAKRGKEDWSITLSPTKDIAASMGKLKTKNQLLIGFALETNNEAFNAHRKLEKKNLDMIVLNSLNDEGAGFMKDTNKVTLFFKSGKNTEYPLLSKQELALILTDQIAKLITEL